VLRHGDIYDFKPPLLQERGLFASEGSFSRGKILVF